MLRLLGDVREGRADTDRHGRRRRSDAMSMRTHWPHTFCATSPNGRWNAFARRWTWGQLEG